MRELFFSQLIELLDKDSMNGDVFSKVKYDQLINNVKRIKEKSCKLPSDHSFLLKYNVVVEDDIDKLVKPVNTGCCKYYVYQEELYDIIYNKHICLNHASFLEVFKSLQVKYINIPLKIVQLCLTFCQSCALQKISISSESSIPVAQLNNQLFSSKSSLPNDPFKKDNLSTSVQPIAVIDLSDDDDGDDDNHYNTQKDYGKVNIGEGLKEITRLDKVNHFNKNSKGVSSFRQCTSGVHKSIDSPLASDNCGPSTPSTSVLPNVSNSVEMHNIVPEQQDELPLVVEEEDEGESSDSLTDVCLSWNLYDSNVKSMLAKFFNEEKFVDVTLECEDKKIKCHQVILSANSFYFERFFSKTPCDNPTLYIKGLLFWELKALIEFIYNGEVKIPKSKVESLLEAAEALEIKGLGEPIEDKINTRRNEQRCKKSFRKKARIKKYRSQFKKCDSFTGTENLNKSDNNQNKSGIHHLGTLNPTCTLSSNVSSQTVEPVPNVYTVFTQTYYPVTTNSHNFIPVNHPSSNVKSLNSPQLSCATVPGHVPPKTCEAAVIAPHMTCNLLSSSPYSSNLQQMAYQNPTQKSLSSSVTVLCTSFTQTSPRRNSNNFQDENEDDGLFYPSKKQKFQKEGQEFNEILFQKTDLMNSNRTTSKSDKIEKRGVRGQQKTCNKTINSCLLAKANTNIIITRKKASDMIAKRTRKKLSERMKRKKTRLSRELL